MKETPEDGDERATRGLDPNRPPRVLNEPDPLVFLVDAAVIVLVILLALEVWRAFAPHF